MHIDLKLDRYFDVGNKTSHANEEPATCINRLFIYYSKCKQKKFIVSIHSGCNHHLLPILSTQECNINTDYRSTVIEAFNRWYKSPKNTIKCNTCWVTDRTADKFHSRAEVKFLYSTPPLQQ